MLRLFNADMNRTLRSPAFWIFCLAGAAIVSILTVVTVQQVQETGPVAWVKSEEAMIGAIGPILLLQMGLFSLFNQDFKSKIHQAAIGNGVSRPKIVLTKYFESVAISAICLLVVYGIVSAVRMVFGVSFTGPQAMEVLVNVASTLATLAGIFAVLMLPLFLFQNLAVSALIGIVLSMDLMAGLLNIIQEATKIDLVKFDFAHNLQLVTRSIRSGDLTIFPIVMVGVYAVLCIGLGMLAFQKRELEF